MMNLQKFLKSYKINLDYFDLDCFEEDIMDIPYQIEVLNNNFDKLSDKEKELFLQLNQKLERKLEKITPKNKLQKKIVLQLEEASKQFVEVAK